jgi:hypothetical protein
MNDFKNRIAQGEAEKRQLLENFYDMVIKAEDVPPEAGLQKVKEIKAQFKSIRAQSEGIDRGISKFQGACEDAEYCIRVWTFADEVRLFGRGGIYDGTNLFGTK